MTDSTPGSAAPGITMSWNVTNSYQRIFTPEEWAAWIESLDESLDPTDLDACYERLDKGDWRSEEWLSEQARDRYWQDTDQAEITDLEAADGA